MLPEKIFASREKISISEGVAKLCANFLQSRSKAIHDFRGNKLICYANDAIGNAINASGFYELTELNAVFSFFSPLHNEFKDAEALDVGANIGNHSIYFSRFFGCVRAFEPHPVTFEILNINAKLYHKIEAFNCGLSEVSGYVEMEENSTNLGGSRIVSHGSFKVKVCRLDDIDLNPSKIKLIKLDVEGHEAAVLRGGSNLIAVAQPIILFEAHLNDFNGPMEEVEILSALGYRFVWMKPLGSGIIRKLRILKMLLTGNKIREFYTGAAIEPADHNMIIAVPQRWQSTLGVY